MGVRIEFARNSGESVLLEAKPQGNLYLIEEWSLEVPFMCPGDLVGASLHKDELLFNGVHVKASFLSGEFQIPQTGTKEIMDELDSFIMEIKACQTHVHFLFKASMEKDLEEVLSSLREKGFVVQVATEEYAPYLVPGSLHALDRFFQSVVSESIKADTNCGKLHPFDISESLEKESSLEKSKDSLDFDAGLAKLLGESLSGQEELDAELDTVKESTKRTKSENFDSLDEELSGATLDFSSFAPCLSRRLPVNLLQATFVDERALESLLDLSKFSNAPQMDVRFSSEEDRVVLRVEGSLVVADAKGDAETVALVMVPFEFQGAVLKPTFATSLLWSTKLNDHDESVLYFYTPPLEKEFPSPLQELIFETYKKLCLSLKDYALLEVMRNRDALYQALHP